MLILAGSFVILLLVILIMLKTNTTTTERIMMALAATSIPYAFTSLWMATILLLSLVVAIGVLSINIDAIPVDPPSVALVKTFGVIINAVIRPRWLFLFPYIEELVLIEVTKVNEDLDFSGVHTRFDEASVDEVKKEEKGALTGQMQPTTTPRVGASMRGTTSVTFTPDYSSARRLKEFLQSGRAQGVINILSDLNNQAVRQVAAGRTWEQMIFAKTELSAQLISLLTGIQPSEKVRLDAQGMPIINHDPHNPALFESRPLEDGEALTKIDIQHFLDTVLVNGRNDIRGLGIRVQQELVTALEPEDPGLQADSNRLAREQQQARSEKADIETENDLADIYIAKAKTAGETITREQALQYVRIRRNPNVRENIFRSQDNVKPQPFVNVGGDGQPGTDTPHNAGDTPDGTQGGTTS